MLVSPDLLTACIQRSLGADVPLPVAAVENWPEFLELADRHSLLPLAAQTLQGTETPVTPELDTAYRTNARRVLILTAELLRITAKLREAGIHPIALKGPALAHAFYPDPALRQFSDLDLLIEEHEFPQARQVLQEQGYTAPENDLFLHRHTEWPFTNNARRIAIDLHWDPMPRGFPARLPQGFRERTVFIHIHSHPVRTLAPADLLLYLCMHGLKHEWTSLMWIVDLCRVLDANPPLDFDVAQANGSARMLQYGLARARELLEGTLDIPEPAPPTARHSGLPVNLLWRLSPNRLAALRYLKHLALTPTAEDLCAFPIPRPELRFLYYPWRWLRLGARSISGAR